MKISQIYFAQSPTKRQTEETKVVTPPQNDDGTGAKKVYLTLASLAVITTAGLLMQKNAATANPLFKQTNGVTKNQNVMIQGDNLTMSSDNLKVDFIPPKGVPINLDKMESSFKTAKNKLEGLRTTDTNYSWIDLPEKLLKENYVGNVYKTVQEFKKPFGNNAKVIFVALGNPSNGDELVKASGLGSNMVYACDTTPAQVKDTIKKAGGDLANIQIIISSKSGSTFESNQTYKLLTAELKKYYEEKGVKSEDIQKNISKHFLMLTDKNPDKSTLKKQANELGIKTIDCVDGLHSGFGDLAYSMPILAYTGMPEDSATKMLKAADKMSKQLMANDLNDNMAAKIAAFDKIAIDKGATKEQFIFHDAHFSDFSSTMEQLYKESLRKLNFTTSVYPRSAHSGLESDINRQLKDQSLSIITNVDVQNNLSNQSADDLGYLNNALKLEKAHIMNVQNEGHFQKEIDLNMGKDGVTPESLGEFMELKSFIAYYKNEFENEGKVDLYKQSYVNGYKEIRKGLVNSELNQDKK